jgi:hypothetical protein
MGMVFSELIEKAIQEGIFNFDNSYSKNTKSDYFEHYKFCINSLVNKSHNYQDIIQEAQSGSISVLPEMRALINLI